MTAMSTPLPLPLIYRPVLPARPSVSLNRSCPRRFFPPHARAHAHAGPWARAPAVPSNPSQHGHPSRSFSTSNCRRNANRKFADAIFSANAPPDLAGRLGPQLSEWSLTPSKKGLHRQFSFKSFAAAWRFMSIVAQECKSKKHHPSWHNLYSQVSIEWTTHHPEGISENDVDMAEFCDRIANDINGPKGTL